MCIHVNCKGWCLSGVGEKGEEILVARYELWVEVAQNCLFLEIQLIRWLNQPKKNNLMLIWSASSGWRKRRMLWREAPTHCLHTFHMLLKLPAWEKQSHASCIWLTFLHHCEIWECVAKCIKEASPPSPDVSFQSGMSMGGWEWLSSRVFIVGEHQRVWTADGLDIPQSECECFSLCVAGCQCQCGWLSWTANKCVRVPMGGVGGRATVGGGWSVRSGGSSCWSASLPAPQSGTK